MTWGFILTLGRRAPFSWRPQEKKTGAVLAAPETYPRRRMKAWNRCCTALSLYYYAKGMPEKLSFIIILL